MPPDHNGLTPSRRVAVVSGTTYFVRGSVRFLANLFRPSSGKWDSHLVFDICTHRLVETCLVIYESLYEMR